MLPLIVGHRGWPEFYPENSLKGFQEAIENGIPAIELDVQISADGIPVVIHDATLERTTSRQGEVQSLSFSELTQISVHEPERFNTNHEPEYMSSLRAVIELIKEFSHVQLFLEVKKEVFVHDDYAKTMSVLSPLMQMAAGQITLISYDDEFLKYVQNTSNIKTGWVLSQYDSTSEAVANKFHPQWLICNHKKVPQDNTSLWQGPWQWMIYDVVDKQLASKLVSQGADAIETWDFKKLMQGPK